MIGATIFAVVFFVFLIAICIGFIILQIRLSKMDSKWPGLVLPAITLLLSLVAAITVFARAVKFLNKYSMRNKMISCDSA